MSQLFARPEVRLLFICAVALAGMVLVAFFARIPLKYNLRNLTVRWRTTITAKATIDVRADTHSA